MYKIVHVPATNFYPFDLISMYCTTVYPIHDYRASGAAQPVFVTTHVIGYLSSLSLLSTPLLFPHHVDRRDSEPM